MPDVSASRRSRRISLALARGERRRENPRRRRSPALFQWNCWSVRCRKPRAARKCQSSSGRKVACTEDAPRRSHKATRPAASASLPRLRLRAGLDQQPRAGRGRERHGDLQLGIIAAAGALIGVGPAVIEHIFAARMRFQVAGRRPQDFAVCGFDQEMLRLPAGRARRPTATLPARTENRARRKG